MTLKKLLLSISLVLIPIIANAQVLGDPVDVSQDFQRMENVYFVGSRVTAFDATTGQGTLQWDPILAKHNALIQQDRRWVCAWSCD